MFFTKEPKEIDQEIDSKRRWWSLSFLLLPSFSSRWEKTGGIRFNRLQIVRQHPELSFAPTSEHTFHISHQETTTLQVISRWKNVHTVRTVSSCRNSYQSVGKQSTYVCFKQTRFFVQVWRTTGSLPMSLSRDSRPSMRLLLLRFCSMSVSSRDCTVRESENAALLSKESIFYLSTQWKPFDLARLLFRVTQNDRPFAFRGNPKQRIRSEVVSHCQPTEMHHVQSPKTHHCCVL